MFMRAILAHFLANICPPLTISNNPGNSLITFCIFLQMFPRSTTIVSIQIRKISGGKKYYKYSSR